VRLDIVAGGRGQLSGVVTAAGAVEWALVVLIPRSNGRSLTTTGTRPTATAASKFQHKAGEYYLFATTIGN